MTDIIHSWPAAPGWAIAAGWAGRAFVWLAAAAFTASVVAWFLGPKGERLGRFGFTLGSLGLFGAFGSLMSLFIGNQFQYKYVYDRASATTTLQYKIAGVWAGQEGSFLLWAVCAALFGLLAVRKVGESFRKWFTIPYAVFLGAISGILAFESPFRLWEVDGKPLTTVPPEGVGLVPALQNYWVVIHPPVIFMGFGSLTVLACWAIAALVTNRVHEWVPGVRPWVLVSASLTGLGLCMGGFWAYETLGWGGFWAWDPVENVSFVPWLLCAALIHGLIVQAGRKKWVSSNLLLGGLPFLSFVYGTFLTRSGFLAETSVHSFAQMERVAHALLLGFFIAATLGFVGLWLWKTRRRNKEWLANAVPSPGGLNREAAYRWSSILLCGLALTIAIGMSVPMFVALAGREAKVVEEWLYHRVVVWFFMPIMVLMAVAPFVAWRRMPAPEFFRRIVNVLSLTFGGLGFAVYFIMHPQWGVRPEVGKGIATPFGLFPLVPWMLCLLFVCLLAMVANLWRMGEVVRRSPVSLGAFLSHFGLAVLLGGLILSRGFERKEQVFVQEGTPGVALGYQINFVGPTSTWNDRDNKVLFEVVEPGGTKFTARPGHYYTFNPGQEPQPMVWPHVQHKVSHDVYVALHPQIIDGEVTPPTAFKVGETKTLNDLYEIKLLDVSSEGPMGQSGATFTAKVSVRGQEGEAEGDLTLRIAGEEIVRRPIMLSEDYLLILDRIEASTGDAYLQLKYNKPWFPIEVFYKPMTILVWAGTGILTFGGLLAAWDRRRAIPGRREATENE